LWTILRRLGVKVAWLAAAIFALHPVNVESVAWVTERKNLLSGFFTWVRLGLSAVLVAEPGGGGSSRHECFGTSATGLGDWKFYWLALAFYLCALLAKTAAIALPAVILLVVWWKRGKVGWREIFPLAPFLAGGRCNGTFHDVGRKTSCAGGG